MCQYNSPTYLSENKRGYITWCENCQIYSMVYETTSIAFTRKEFKSFYQVLNELKEDYFKLSHSDKETVFLRSAKNYFGLNLTRSQVEDLKEMIGEASRMHEIYGLIT